MRLRAWVPSGHRHADMMVPEPDCRVVMGPPPTAARYRNLCNFPFELKTGPFHPHGVERDHSQHFPSPATPCRNIRTKIANFTIPRSEPLQHSGEEKGWTPSFRLPRSS